MDLIVVESENIGVMFTRWHDFDIADHRYVESAVLFAKLAQLLLLNYREFTVKVIITSSGVSSSIAPNPTVLLRTSVVWHWAAS